MRLCFVSSVTWSVCCAFVFSSRRRHTRCALVTGVQTCALPISGLVLFQLSSGERPGTLAASLAGALTAIGKPLDDVPGPNPNPGKARQPESRQNQEHRAHDDDQENVAEGVVQPH